MYTAADPHDGRAASTHSPSMIDIGKIQRLQVIDRVDFGLYLNAGDEGRILLPNRDVPPDCKVGQWLDVFVYLDSEDRIIATTATPPIQVGQCAWLEVVQINDIGAFVDWGLPKNLFVPYAEQRWRMHVGRSYVVAAFVDNTGRIAASTKLRRHLGEPPSAWEVGQEVDLLVASHTDLGYEVVVEDTCLGLIFDGDALKPLRLGQRLRGTIKTIRPDGKIDLALQRHDKAAKRELADEILQRLKDQGGSLDLTDKSTPEAVYAAFGVSKKVYKKALGGLFKLKKIVIEPDRIRLP